MMRFIGRVIKGSKPGKHPGLGGDRLVRSPPATRVACSSNRRSPHCEPNRRPALITFMKLNVQAHLCGGLAYHSIPERLAIRLSNGESASLNSMQR